MKRKEGTSIVKEGTWSHQSIHAFLGHFVTNQRFTSLFQCTTDLWNFMWPYIKGNDYVLFIKYCFNHFVCFVSLNSRAEGWRIDHLLNLAWIHSWSTRTMLFLPGFVTLCYLNSCYGLQTLLVHPLQSWVVFTAKLSDVPSQGSVAFWSIIVLLQSCQVDTFLQCAVLSFLDLPDGFWSAWGMMIR